MIDSRVKRIYFFSIKMYYFKDFILFYVCKVGKKIVLILFGYIYIFCKKKILLKFVFLFVIILFY